MMSSQFPPARAFWFGSDPNTSKTGVASSHAIQFYVTAAQVTSLIDLGTDKDAAPFLHPLVASIWELRLLRLCFFYDSRFHCFLPTGAIFGGGSQDARTSNPAAQATYHTSCTAPASPLEEWASAI